MKTMPLCSWTRRVLLALVLLVATGVLIGLSATWSESTRAMVPLGIGFFLAAVWLCRLMGRARRAEAAVPPWSRVALTGLLLAVGVVLVRKSDVPGTYFLGLALAALALAWLVSELRHLGYTPPPAGTAPGTAPASTTSPAVAAPTSAADTDAGIGTTRWHPGLTVGLLGAAMTALVAARVAPAGGGLLTALVLGLVLAEVGIELLSQHVTWDRLPWSRWGWLAAGSAVVVAVAAVFIGRFHLHPGHLAVVLLVLVGLVLLASTDNDILVLVGLLGVAFAWAAIPREADLPGEQVAVAGDDYFLVLGDSYLSGEGADEFLPHTNTKDDDPDEHSNECRRAPTAWPARLAGALPSGMPGRVLFLACSGAVTENIAGRARLTEPAPVSGDGDRVAAPRHRGPAELRVFRDRRTRDGLGWPDFVLVGIGGNDAGFSRIGKTCIGPGSCAEVAGQFIDDGAAGPTPEPVPGPREARVPDGAEDLASIADDLDEAYRRVRLALRGAPDPVPVIAVSYPIPVVTDGDCQDLLLDRDERWFVRHFVVRLNDLIEATAARHGFLYMDLESALVKAGKALCNGLSPAGLNFLDPNPTAGDERQTLNPTNWMHNNLHPNDEGHDVMLGAAADWFEQRASLADDARAAREAAATAPEVALPTLADTYDDFVVPGQCDPSRDRDCDIDDARWSHDQAQAAYRRGIVPVTLLVAGLWVLLAAARWKTGRLFRGPWDRFTARAAPRVAGLPFVPGLRAAYRWVVGPSTAEPG